jgi:hypothetical protein
MSMSKRKNHVYLLRDFCWPAIVFEKLHKKGMDLVIGSGMRDSGTESRCAALTADIPA